MGNNIILEGWHGMSYEIGSNMYYWVLTASGKVISRTNVHNVIHTTFLDPDMKWRIDKFDEKLQNRLDDTNFVDDVGADLYIGDMDEANEAAHEDGSNTPE